MRTMRPVVVMAAAAAACVALTSSPVPAQSAPPPPAPVVIVDNTTGGPVFDGIALMPGEKQETDLDVGGFARVAFLAVSDSEAAAMGRVGVRTVFGPPAVGVDNHLVLAFHGATHAAASDHMPILGPRLHVAVVNNTNQPVTVTVSYYAVK